MTDDETDGVDGPGVVEHGWQLVLFQFACHLLVVIMLTLLSLWLQLGSARLADFRHVLAADGLFGPSFGQIATHVAVVAAGWGLVVALYLRATTWKHNLAEAESLFSRETGSVLTETLIVLPVALFLVFALAQLAINNTVAMLVELATFQASRSAWVWSSEAQVDRMDADINPDDAVRTQVAAVMTPVAPGNRLLATSLPQRAEDMRAMFVGSQLPVPGSGSDRYSYTLARHHIEETSQLSTDQFISALDTDQFIARSARKFTLAYHMSQVRITDDIESSEENPEVRVEVTYHHINAMPLVGELYGDWTEHAGIGGYFSDFERTATRQMQPPPSDTWPEGKPVRTIAF